MFREALTTEFGGRSSASGAGRGLVKGWSLDWLRNEVARFGNEIHVDAQGSAEAGCRNSTEPAPDLSSVECVGQMKVAKTAFRLWR
jgi:hypothetical protein